MSSGKVDCKVVLLGKAYVGKTSLVERYIHNRFNGDVVPYQNTIGAAFGAKTVVIDNESIVVGVWDTAGSERYEAMSRIYYRGATAAIVCYDLTDRSSLDRARFWIGELQKFEDTCKIYLCGTKYDLIENDPTQRKINAREIRALAIDVQGQSYETSSKSGKDIDTIFRHIAADYMATRKPSKLTPKEEPIQISGSQKWNVCSGCR